MKIIIKPHLHRRRLHKTSSLDFQQQRFHTLEWTMFTRLTDFGYPRSLIGALGFYVSYFALIVIAGMIIGVLLHSFMPHYPMREARAIAAAFSMLTTMTLALLILQSKNLNTSIPHLMLALASTVLAGIGGAALGLLIPTYFSTLEGTQKKRKKK